MPVLYISGSEDSDNRARLVQGRNFLRKPFDPDEFLATVDRLVEGRGQPLAPAAYSDELAATAPG
jgi:DNA-binding response OmpR family regulator